MFKANQSYVSVYRGQDNFMFCPDGISLVPRAHIEILEQCPASVRDQVSYALAKGWIQPVANMRDTEYTMELLKK
jgi:hypothetical protein